MKESVWVFHGDGATFSSGVFSEYSKAQSWIKKHGLTGLLTEYPLNNGAYDWCVEMDYFTPKKPLHHEGKFIGSFTSASQPHFRFENGEEL
ncbi:DUF7710 domain-containing protein [Pseudoalteromonas luteoviolacea]|uniref:DUF7710 domain-containing protein n=1 Tax=Pseudoalteromonas luteoviolacea S4054 TaxID=1129367 RepID=A0A0F6AD48_9GAMM|nr:hypothetical protein [Pseudoalteromonas luteoviolacea]AOT08214.1 hypothetical protein S4054249_10340 [Pseudoalteromonas luteoviolacea]AOT13130.1 hypothetical protein S40542_10315 [Pseudoalteromonas luteoviolacea]AOT18042.1 hypothetical protein S4054_10310 [Pseudoalteromonas luteoviolacea]KKE84142.1 hypothetical protein N479_09590 [Pseudoalteromonas luteoviolacea S4054]KZN76253.1 hypothetical protein N481_07825 [Pseudoalteromonas luteoviolacea S4047-1]